MFTTKTLSITLLCLALLAVKTSAADRPNILYIMSDDHAAHAWLSLSGD